MTEPVDIHNHYVWIAAISSSYTSFRLMNNREKALEVTLAGCHHWVFFTPFLVGFYKFFLLQIDDKEKHFIYKKLNSKKMKKSMKSKTLHGTLVQISLGYILKEKHIFLRLATDFI